MVIKLLGYMATIIWIYIVSLNAPWLIPGCQLILLSIVDFDIPCDDSENEWWYLQVQYIDAIIHSYTVSYNVPCLDLGCRVILLGTE